MGDKGLPLISAGRYMRPNQDGCWHGFPSSGFAFCLPPSLQYFGGSCCNPEDHCWDYQYCHHHLENTKKALGSSEALVAVRISSLHMDRSSLEKYLAGILDSSCWVTVVELTKVKPSYRNTLTVLWILHQECQCFATIINRICSEACILYKRLAWEKQNAAFRHLSSTHECHQLLCLRFSKDSSQMNTF